jgi:CheY-like chemotaxis protein
MPFFDFRKTKREKPLIFVVDDEAPLRQLWASYLDDLSCDTSKFEDGAEAIKSAQEKKPDLILLDISMPSMNGFEVLSALKASPLTKDIPVLMLTGEQKGKDIDSAFARGAVGYIVKPPDYLRFCAKVKEILLKQGYAFPERPSA